MAVLDKHGFRTYSPTKAIKVAEMDNRGMVQDFKIGQIIKIRSWHGVILDVHYSADGRPSVLKVQTARNVFRKLGPELIDLTLAPESIQTATLDDLKGEIEKHQEMLEGEIAALVGAPIPDAFKVVFDD